MQMKNLLFVMNPQAGQKKANRLLPEILDIFCRAGYRVHTYLTAGVGDAARYVREQGHGVDLIVSCGGDGTFNEVVSGVLEGKLAVSLGHIPAGSTNDLAVSLGLPLKILDAARLVVEGVPYPMDIGRMNHRYFTYVASFGAFTRVSYATPQSMKNALGNLAYVLEGITELSQIRKIPVRVEPREGELMEEELLFCSVSNTTSVGGILSLDPNRVDMSDGMLELLMIRAPKDVFELTACIRALRTQKYEESRMITFRSVSGAKLSFGENVTWTLDGEKEDGTNQVEVAVLPCAISLIGKEKE